MIRALLFGMSLATVLQFVCHSVMPFAIQRIEDIATRQQDPDWATGHTLRLRSQGRVGGQREAQHL